jgi:hypothetical protein
MDDYPYPVPVLGVGRIVGDGEASMPFLDAALAWTGYRWRSGVFGWAASPMQDGRILEVVAIGPEVRITRIHRRVTDAIEAARAAYRAAVRSDLARTVWGGSTA